MATKTQQCNFSGAHWLDASAPSKEFLSNLGKTYNLPRSMVKDCMEPEHLPKFERSGKVNFLILRASDPDATYGLSTIQELTRKIAVFWTDEYIITLHRKDFAWMEQLRQKWAEKTGEPGASAIRMILEELADAVMQSYEPVIDYVEVELEKLEDRVMSLEHGSLETSPHLLEGCYQVKRKSSSYKRVFRLTRDLYYPLTGEVHYPMFQTLKDEADRLYLYADDLVESVGDLLQVYISLTSYRTNESSHKTNEIMRFLTIFSVFFMPINFIASVYGMNFAHMPELQQSWGYPAALSLMVVVEIAIYLWFRHRGWLK